MPDGLQRGEVGSDRLIVGKLLGHGRAPHEFKAGAAPSYFIRIETERGERTVWEAALERALARSESKPKIGEPIGVRENGGERTARASAEAGAPRRHFIVERREFFDERLAAAKLLRDVRIHPREAVEAFPDLVGAYFVLASASALIRERSPSTETQARFVALVRESLARTVEIGEPLPQVRLRDRELLERGAKDEPLVRSL